MRTPTTREVAYAWWTNAMKGILADDFASNADQPQCGWYKRRLVKNGPWCPAKIWLDAWIDEETGELMGDETLLCEVNGEFADPYDQWLWLCANPISEAEFNYLNAARDFAQRYEPDSPHANQRQAVDWMKVPPPTF